MGRQCWKTTSLEPENITRAEGAWGAPPLRENSNQKFERQRNGQERASLILSGGRSSSGRSTGMGGGNFSRHWHPGLRQAWKWVGHKGSERRCPGDSIGAWSWTGGPGELPAPPKLSYTAVRVCIEVGLRRFHQFVTPWKPF